MILLLFTGAFCDTVEPLLRGHPYERPHPLERPIDNVNLKINVLISTPDARPPLLKGHFSDAKGMASQEGFHCICNNTGNLYHIKQMFIINSIMAMYFQPIRCCRWRLSLVITHLPKLNNNSLLFPGYF